MRGGSEKRRGESGQALVLGALLMVVLLGFTALTVDVGFFLRHRAVVQQAVDAAALAGAQVLPDQGPAAAEQMARDYAEKNGMDPDTLEVSFRCTSGYQLACDPAIDKWDTIEVSGSLDVPFFFAPVLKLTGVENKCWFGACPVVETAAGCRGLCGGSPFQAVDVVTIIDHTGSMSSSDLANAKEGALAMYEYFDADLHRVGLGVTPPVDPTNQCDSINSWGDPEVWLPVPLTDDYQTAPHVLDTGSPLVSTTQCLDRPSYSELPGIHTKLGDPVKAAAAELVANGRPDEKWGVILLSDGAANVYHGPVVNGDTGLLSPSAQAAVTSSAGDNNGFESSPTNAYADGGGYATDNNSGTGTSTSCGSTAKDKHRYYNYGISLPSGATVAGIEVRLDAWANGTGTRRMCVELSWNGGSSWTTAQQTPDFTTSEATYYVGGPTDTWGRSWTSSNLSNSNFRVRITDVANSTSREFYLDWVAVKVHYTVPVDEGVLGPCDYAYKQAVAAKAADIEMFVIAWGADDYCDYESPSSPWDGASAVELLQAMATDELHFYNEPKTTDLAPIFEVIGSQLATGSRLVPTSVP